MSFGERPPTWQPGQPQGNGQFRGYGPPPATWGTPTEPEPKKRDLPMWAVAMIAIPVGACSLFGLVGSWKHEREQAARSAAENRRLAEEARAASARASVFASRRAEFDAMAVTARARNNAAQLDALASLVRPFDTGYADRLANEAGLTRLADTCAATQRVSCVDLSRLIVGAGEPRPSTVDRARAACVPLLEADLRVRTAGGAGLSGMHEPELRDAYNLAGCIEGITGLAATPAMSTIAAVIRGNEGRWHLIGRPEPFRYTGGGGGYSRGGRGRCRDSRGRFTRCS